MRRRQEALRALARHFAHRVEEQHPAPALRRLAGAADDDARLHRRVVEQVRPEAEHAVDEVALDQGAAHRGLLVAEQDAVREEDGAAAGPRVEARQDVLEEGVVGPALRRRAEEVAAPRVVPPRVAAPGLDGVRRIGEHHVEGHQAVAFDEGGVAQRVADRDAEVLHAVQHEVHARDRRRRADDLLPVEAERARVAAAAPRLGEGRDEHAAGAGGRVVDALAGPRPEHPRHQVHQGAVGVELLRGVAAVVGELLDEVLVGVAQLVFGHRGEAERVAREVLDQVLERRVRHLRLVGPRRGAEHPGQALRVGRLEGAERVPQRPADVARRPADVGPVGAGRDGEPVVGRRPRVAVVAGLVEGGAALLVPDVGEALEEEQREDVLLVVAGVDQPAQEVGGAPEVRLQRLPAEAFNGHVHYRFTLARSAAGVSRAGIAPRPRTAVCGLLPKEPNALPGGRSPAPPDGRESGPAASRAGARRPRPRRPEPPSRRGCAQDLPAPRSRQQQPRRPCRPGRRGRASAG